MSTQPAFETVLEVHGQSVTLRASLRAATAIDAMPGGFPAIWDQISRLSWSAVRAVILATATDRQDAHRFLAKTADMPLRETLLDAQAACLAVLASILPEPTEPPQGHPTASAPMTLRAYFQSLFDYATGWLAWTPAETWTASPAEIGTAFAAHVDRLVKMTPGMSCNDSDQHTGSAYSAERLQEIEEPGHDPAFDRGALDRLRAQNKQR